MKGSPPKSRMFAECVGGILIENGRVLVEKRRANDEADPGLIVLPGGHVDKGESLGQALRREMWEELGIHVEKAKFVLKRIYTASDGEKQRIHYFQVEKWKGNIRSSEAESVYWESRLNNLDDALERRVVHRLLSKRAR
jgi:8-oxo-dGTP diphosphatase